MENKNQNYIKNFLSILKNYVKTKDKTFKGKINSDYLQNYKSTLIKNTELTLKFRFSLLQNIIITENEIYQDSKLLTTDIIIKIFSFIEKTLTEQLSFFEFCRNLFLISSEIKYIFKISLLISKIYKIEYLYYYDYFCFLLFKNNFQNGLDLLYGIDSICDLPKFLKKYDFSNFLDNIKNNYKNYENEEECYIKVFKSNDELKIKEYVEQIGQEKENMKKIENLLLN